MDDKINIKDIHSTLWRCRDFELSHLWQRSIFLATFLVFSFTAYGCVLLKMFDSDLSEINLVILHSIAFGISLIGGILSLFWIMMGKGSKAWYEKYESAISAMEINIVYAEDDVKEIGGFNYNSIDGYKEKELEDKIFNTDGGRYSVSRINIAVGQLFLILWCIIALIHLLIIIISSVEFSKCCNSYFITAIDIIVGISVVLICKYLICSRKVVKSNTL